MSSGVYGSPLVTVKDGTGRTYDFFDNATFRSYLNQLATGATIGSLSSYLDEFKTFPQVDEVLVTYFDEAVKSSEGKQRIAGSILVGCLSELLVLRLLKTIGEYLGDVNSVQNYLSKKNNIQRQFDFTKQMVVKGRVKIEATGTLTAVQPRAFRDFDDIAVHAFDSIRLRRNEYVHPTPDLTLDTLPSADVIANHIQAFNPYAKVFLTLIDMFKNAVP